MMKVFQVDNHDAWIICLAHDRGFDGGATHIFCRMIDFHRARKILCE